MWGFRRCFEPVVEGASLGAPVEEEEEEDGERKAALAVKPRCLAPGEEPGGLWMAEWGGGALGVC